MSAAARQHSATPPASVVRGTLSWLHWCIIAASILLTLAAWLYSKHQLEERAQSRFNREADRVVKLVAERLRKYEDALWGAVGTIQTHGGEISHAQWRTFSSTLRIENKYPGINGIGVIHHVTPETADDYLSEQRQTRPTFTIHPIHGRHEFLPVTFVEPTGPNLESVGLDMAHEPNRYEAAKQARDSGTARMTGPIVLVQDAQRTPGFLLYVPFYGHGGDDTLESRRERFAGLVYAPFVVTHLMEGTLSRSHRHVGIRIEDGGSLLYDEHVETVADFDPEPLFSRTVDVEIYGRTWSFDVHSTKSFRALVTNTLPVTILIGGLTIDLLLFFLFLTLSRTSRQAIAFARSANVDLIKRTRQLERSNAELEQFAYVSSHDLQEPIRMVASYTELLQTRYADQFDEKANRYMGYVVEGAQRMQQLVDALLEYSRVDGQSRAAVATDADDVVEDVLRNLAVAIDETRAEVRRERLPTVLVDPVQLTQVIQNLIANGIKFRGDSPPRIRVFSRIADRWTWTIGIEDNGIGINPEFHDRIFTIFKRLHQRDQYSGTGLGLAIAKKIIQRHGGKIWVESAPGSGSTFYFTVPAATSNGRDPEHAL